MEQVREQDLGDGVFPQNSEQKLEFPISCGDTTQDEKCEPIHDQLLEETDQMKKEREQEILIKHQIWLEIEAQKKELQDLELANENEALKAEEEHKAAMKQIEEERQARQMQLKLEAEAKRKALSDNIKKAREEQRTKLREKEENARNYLLEKEAENELVIQEMREKAQEDIAKIDQEKEMLKEMTKRSIEDMKKKNETSEREIMQKFNEEMRKNKVDYQQKQAAEYRERKRQLNEEIEEQEIVSMMEVNELKLEARIEMEREREAIRERARLFKERMQKRKEESYRGFTKPNN